MTTRVLVADDHAIVRAGLRALLATDATIEVVGETDTADGAVDFCRTREVDVVLMDLHFGPASGSGSAVTSDGVTATRALCALAPPPRVLVVTSYDTDADILAAVEAGAAGYLLKDTPPAELTSAVHAAAAGRSALSPAVAARLMNRVRAAPDTTLTARETEVLALVGRGESNRDIARSLFLSELTVKSHLVHVFTKLGVRSRTAAVAAARDRGLIG